MQRSIAPVLAGLALGLAVCGCATQKVSLGEGPREYVAFDYEAILKRWTRSGSLVALAELDDLLTVSSTYQSWDFRWAYTVRFADDHRLTIDQRRAMLEDQLGKARAEHEFYIALYGPNRRWSDISKKQTAWVVRLVDDQGSETEPLEIKSIRNPGPLERTYFPYTSVWRQAFRVRFPRQKADGSPAISTKAKWFGLRFAGPQGHQELVWELEDGAQSAALQVPPSTVALAP